MSNDSDNDESKGPAFQYIHLTFDEYTRILTEFKDSSLRKLNNLHATFQQHLETVRQVCKTCSGPIEVGVQPDVTQNPIDIAGPSDGTQNQSQVGVDCDGTHNSDEEEIEQSYMVQENSLFSDLPDEEYALIMFYRYERKTKPKNFKIPKYIDFRIPPKKLNKTELKNREDYLAANPDYLELFEHDQENVIPNVPILSQILD
jgi:hypothetical protein